MQAGARGNARPTGSGRSLLVASSAEQANSSARVAMAIPIEKPQRRTSNPRQVRRIRGRLCAVVRHDLGRPDAGRRSRPDLHDPSYRQTQRHRRYLQIRPRRLLGRRRLASSLSPTPELRPGASVRSNTIASSPLDRDRAGDWDAIACVRTMSSLLLRKKRARLQGVGGAALPVREAPRLSNCLGPSE
jgi:hypothetical protein